MKKDDELTLVQIAFGDFANIDTTKAEPQVRRMSLATTGKAMAYSINVNN